ncbi:hypothetical protein [Mangrovibacillus cuniculi]|uniref:Amidohydrolase-related domain-containing protein n=1 Tax=Mangrovibacillus cuniculi TaxID=2593652 RepID=A0A7S8CBB0_9BACI|nr:hypothetical protein [Mangrovibacillus cuniculi]QPC46691.1 hypothetical protein G8O30_06815 [Mangrovibacillus cuniculi]
MSFIMDNVHLVNDSKIQVTSLLIENNKFASIRNGFPYYRHTRMDTTPFIMTPTKVVYDSKIGVNSCLKDFRQIQKGYIAKGITTVITSFEPPFLHSFEKTLRKRRKELYNSVLDYALLLTCPIEKLTIDWIRTCQKTGIPAIIVRISGQAISTMDMNKWRWFKEVVRFSPIMFLPQFDILDDKVRKKWEQWWENKMHVYFLPHSVEPLENGSQISLQNLKKIGLYPKRGKLLVGGELSYNLFYKSSLVDASSALLYDDSTLALTIQRGQAIYINGKINYSPGFGEELDQLFPNTFV